MRHGFEVSLPAGLRQLWRLAALLAALVIVAACSGQPSLEPIDGSAKTPGKPVPAVALREVAGVPPGQLQDLSTALAMAAGQRDIGIVEGSTGFQNGMFSLSARLRADAGAAGVIVSYQWQLRDASGVLVHTIEGSQSAGLFTGADAWAAVTPTVWERIAKSTAQSMATRMAQLGYATRVSALAAPPADHFVRAGPGAEREIDMALLTGSSATTAAFDGMAANAELAGSATAIIPNDATPASAPADVAASPPVETPTEPVIDPEGKVQIRAVAVVPVQGSGRGDQELTAAMRKTLSEAGWPVVSRPQPDAIIVAGRVKIAEAKNGTQQVTVSWEVQTPTGSKLGDVKQANQIPAGALNSGWGSAALAVAQAAAPGVYDIVKRFQ